MSSELFKVFKIDQDSQLPILSAEARNIIAYKNIISRDKGSKGDVDGRRKYQAIKELAFVYYAGAVGSRYFVKYKKSDKEDRDKVYKEIKLDLGLEDNWNPNDPAIQHAIKFWEEEQRSELTETLDTLKSTLRSIREYLKNIDLNETITEGSAKGQLLHDPNKVSGLARNLKKDFDIIKELEREIVEEQNAKIDKARGGIEINPFEESSDDDE